VESVEGYEERHADLKEVRVRKRRRSTKDSRRLFKGILGSATTASGLRSSAASNVEQRVRVLVPNAQGFYRTTKFLMQEYLNLVDWRRATINREKVQSECQ